MNNLKKDIPLSEGLCLTSRRTVSNIMQFLIIFKYNEIYWEALKLAVWNFSDSLPNAYAMEYNFHKVNEKSLANLENFFFPYQVILNSFADLKWWTVLVWS